MRTNTIKSLLENLGHEVELHTFNKNGVEKNGLIFSSAEGNAKPIIYLDDILSRTEDDHEVVTMVLDVLKNAECFSINTSETLSKSFIMENVYIAFFKSVSAEVISRESEQFPGIIETMYVRISNDATFKVTEGTLSYANIDVNELWDVAKQNTINTALLDNFFGMNVVTNALKTFGASCVLNSDLVKKVAEEHGTDKVVMIPSSIHECLLVHYDGETDIELFNSMVRDVNETELKAEEVLADRAYIIDVTTL